MDSLGRLWKHLLLCVVVILIGSISVEGSFEDMRCRCVCPKRQVDNNNTRPSQTVYIDPNHDPNLCTCDYVVATRNPEETCSKCECKYESRNTTTIKVVVISIICIISLLFVYMLFLLCLEPLILHRRPHYHRHADEEINEPMLTVLAREGQVDDDTLLKLDRFPDDPTCSRPVELETSAAARQRSILNRVQDEQKKWKGTVVEQRKNIYDRHSMLN